MLTGYSLGLFAGAAVIASVLYMLGKLWAPGMLIVGCVALALGGARFLRPDTVAFGGFEVPRHWEILGPVTYLSVFGAFLGAGVVTTMPSATMLALLLWAWATHSYVLIIVAFGGFAAARLGTTIATWMTGQRLNAPGSIAADVVEQRLRFLARVEAVVCVGLGAILLAAALSGV